jgi:hypothetical protein
VSQGERFGTRPGEYSAWHRRSSTRRFATWGEAERLAMIDLNAALYDVISVAQGVPNPTALAAAYRHMTRLAMVQQALDAALDTLPAEDTIAVPDTLADEIRDAIMGTTTPWDEALWDLVCKAQEEE